MALERSRRLGHFWRGLSAEPGDGRIQRSGRAEIPDLGDDSSDSDDEEHDAATEGAAAMIVETLGGDEDDEGALIAVICGVLQGRSAMEIARAVFTQSVQATHDFQQLQAALESTDDDRIERLSRLLIEFADQLEGEIDDDSDEDLEDEPEPITQKEVDRLYISLHDQIQAASKRARARRKPLLVLVGEQHHEKSSYLPEHLILDIVRRLQINNVALELTPQIAAIITQAAAAPPNLDQSESAANQSVWFHNIVAGGSNLIGADKHKRPQGSPALSGEALEQDVNRRNEGIVETLEALQTHALMVVGASHLQGIAESLEGFEILPLNVADPDVMRTRDLLLEDKPRESTAWALNPRKATQVGLQGSLDQTTPPQLEAMARAAAQNFRQVEALRGERERLKGELTQALLSLTGTGKGKKRTRYKKAKRDIEAELGKTKKALARVT